MDTTLDLSRWREAPRGVSYRRGTIIFTGLRQQLRGRFFKFLVAAGWISGLMVAALGFVLSQSVASGGWLESLASRLGPRAEAIVAALAGMVTLYPDVCYGGMFTLIFWLHASIGLTLTLVALTTMVPRLVTRDLASNALTIYLSRPLTTADYLVGKLGTIVATIVLVWTGPLIFGWLVSMLFATDSDFVFYSLSPLLRALLFNAIALTAISAIALGVSAVARTSRTSSLLWIGMWIILGFIAAPPHAPLWLKRASFSYDLNQVRGQVFKVDDAFTRASRSLPLLNQHLTDNLAAAGRATEASDFSGALLGLGVLVVGSSAVFFRKLRSE